MDISKTYIKMCEQAVEIQALASYPYAEVKIGDDWVWRFESTTDLDRQWQQGQNRKVWLPRQDQLQEMVGGLECGFIDWENWLGNIYGYNYGNKPNGHLHIFDTYEQLWLAFVIKEKFGKVWNGEDWFKI